MKLLAFADSVRGLDDVSGFLALMEERVGAVEACAAVVAKEVSSVEEKARLGLKRIYVILAERTFPDQAAKVLESLFKEMKPELVVAPATKNGNEVLARLAGRLGIAMLTEVVDVEQREGALAFKRPILGGRALSVEKPSLPACVSVQPRRFQPRRVPERSELVTVEAPGTGYKLIKVEGKARGGVNIEEAQVVVGVGRGFRSKDDLRLAQQLAELLNGALGCTRPIAADYGWLPEDAWIGISGKRIRPKLYLAIGISGAPQHMTAAMDAKVIVAINKDRNAPVFQYADYGVVADLYEFIPVLVNKIRERLRGA